MSLMSLMSLIKMAPVMRPKATDGESLRLLASAVIDIEAAAVAALKPRIDATFVAACELLLTCSGRIVVCAIGKSGHIGSKLAATFASTGSPAFFIHAAEASHGDLGMMQPGDIVIAISYSGSSRELLALIPGIKRIGVPLISLCGEAGSPLAAAADINIDVSVEREACPLGLAPTASTTATLAMGDALAVALLGSRGFDEQDFARSHPGGRLGRRLLLRVSDVMISGDATPKVPGTVRLADALIEISRKGLGMVTVVDELDKLKGVFTDGDLRRAIDRNEDIREIMISDVMTTGAHTIDADSLAVSAVSTMQELRVTALPVIDDKRVIGVITMHSLLAAGVV
jgi:arabinose-5-phosphate isomerase